MNPLAAAVVFAYLGVALAVGVGARRKGRDGVEEYVAGGRAFGPVVMYFVMGATIFSAFALLGTPQRVAARGSDVFYILAYGAVGFVPVFFFGGRVRRIGARAGYVTQAELVGGRFDSRAVTAVMGGATVLALLPYVVIQLKAAGIVMEAATGWPREVGALVVYAVVTTYVVVGGVRGVGFTNVLQGIIMLVVVWSLGFWVTDELYGGVGPMFDRVVAEAPEFLTLPGPGPTSPAAYTSEVLVSALGFCMWPQVFMKCFAGRSERMVQLSAVLYPTFLFFLLPLIWLGYVVVLEGGPTDDTAIFWIASLPGLAESAVPHAAVAFAVLAASMSTGDALLHAAASIFVRDVLVNGAALTAGDRVQTRLMKVGVVAMAGISYLVFLALGDRSVVDLLLLAYAVILQFLPATLLGLYWRQAGRRAALAGLGAGLSLVVILFGIQVLAPGAYSAINPLGLQIGVLAVGVNLVVMVVGSVLGQPLPPEHLRRFDL